MSKHACLEIGCSVYVIWRIGVLTSVKISVWKQDWSNEGPDKQQQTHPTGSYFDPHCHTAVCKVMDVTGFWPEIKATCI